MIRKMFVVGLTALLSACLLCSCGTADTKPVAEVSENDAIVDISDKTESAEVSEMEQSSEAESVVVAVSSATANSKNANSKAPSSKIASSKVESNKTNSSEGVSSTLKNIDEVPPIVLDGEPVDFKNSLKVNLRSLSYSYRMEHPVIFRTQQNILDTYEAMFENANESEKKYKDEDIINLKAAYPETFFEDNALVFFVSWYGSGGYSNRIDAVVKKDNSLLVGMTHFAPDGPAVSVVVPWRIILEVKQADIVGISTSKFAKK